MIGLTGAGNVSQGAKDMLDALGVQWVEPKDLATLAQNGEFPSRMQAEF